MTARDPLDWGNLQVLGRRLEGIGDVDRALGVVRAVARIHGHAVAEDLLSVRYGGDTDAADRICAALCPGISFRVEEAGDAFLVACDSTGGEGRMTCPKEGFATAALAQALIAIRASVTPLG